MTIPQTMRALVLKHDGYSGTSEGPAIKTLEPYLEERQIAVPQPGPGEVLVEVGLGGINPSDLHFIKGEYGRPRVKGAPGGFEGMGTVVAAGQGAEKLVGKRAGFVAGRSGSWAQYAIADASSCVPVLDAVRDEDAAALFVNPLTAIAMFEEMKKSQAKSFIMTAAASQLCKFIAGLARDEGYEAIAIVRRDEHLETLKGLGAAHALNSAKPDFLAQIGKLIGETKPRVLLDAVADQISSDIFFSMGSRARWIIYGKLSSEAPLLTQPGQFIFMDKKIEGFWLSSWLKHAPREEVFAAGAKVQQRFASGAWKTDVAAIVPLGEAMTRIPNEFAGANHGKVFIKP
ncbi:MAG: zinc-binding dehydrogenase [Nitratireductor sp.]|nr:zinc-binding dehydrogenase [Nitratireductor sp.]